MDVLKKIDQLELYIDLMKENLDVLKSKILKQEKSKKSKKISTSDLVAKAKARRAISRLS